MRKTSKVALGTGTVLALAIATGLPANADVQPNTKDVVGVGSDTVQYVGDFLDNGYNATGIPQAGYNNTPRIYRIFNFDATADAAGRAQYGAAGRTSSGPFPSAAIYRAGNRPLYRPQGSGDGFTSFLADATAPYKINFIRSSRLPKPAEQTAATSAGFGGLHVYKIATDGLDVAVNTKAANVTVAGDPVTCVPDDGLTVSELVEIYKGNITTFGAITNYATRKASPGSCATEPIAPLTPDASKSGTGKDFKGDLDAVAGTITYSPGRVVFVEEHDPAAVSFPTTTVNKLPDNTVYGAQDTVAPFSTGRYNLIQSGYFDQTLALAGGTSPVYANTISLQIAGASGVQAGAYHKSRTLYIVVRENDVTSGTAFLPGGTQNWVQTFFAPGGWYDGVARAATYTAAGVVRAYADLGIVSA